MMNDAHGVRFWVSLGVGWSMIGLGVALLVNAGGFDRVFDVGLWVVGLDLVHDLAFAPVVTVIALIAASVFPSRFRAPVLAGLGASAVVLLVAWPLLGGYGRREDNPTVLPRDYGASVAIVLAVVWGLAALWLIFRLIRCRRRCSPCVSPALRESVEGAESHL